MARFNGGHERLSFGDTASLGPAEALVSVTPHIRLEVTVSGKKFTAEGSANLTTDRLIFKAEPPSVQHGVQLKDFEVPLSLISSEAFNQPIFGCNNLSGVVQMSELPGDMGVGLYGGVRNPDFIHASFRMEFRGGGFGTFAPVFMRALSICRRRQPAVTAVPIVPGTMHNNPGGANQTHGHGHNHLVGDGDLDYGEVAPPPVAPGAAEMQAREIVDAVAVDPRDPTMLYGYTVARPSCPPA